jgi:adenylate cyclase
VTLSACAFCAVAPLAAGHLLVGTVASTAIGWSYHSVLVVLVPLNVVLLWVDYRVHHRNALPLVLGTLGAVFVLWHTFEHLAENSAQDRSVALAEPMWLGMTLLIAAAALDFHWLQASRRGSAACDPEEYWRSVLTGVHPGLRAGRRLYGALPATRRCKLCSVPIVGRLAPLMRLAGKAASEMNPNFCAECLTAAPLGGAEIEVSLLFIDVRGSTALAEHIGATAFAQEISAFYEVAIKAIVAADGLVDKLVGDEVIGLFLPGFAGEHHPDAALNAAARLLEHSVLPAGIAVHTGIAYVGMVGAAGKRDLTALGDVMNTAARLVALASAGEVIVSEDAVRASRLNPDSGHPRHLTIRGRVEPIAARVLTTITTGPTDPPQQRALGHVRTTTTAVR